MIAVHHRLTEQRLSAKMLLQIHDELVFESPEEELPMLAGLVRECMTGVLTLDVPLKVDVKIGDNWADCEELKLP